MFCARIFVFLALFSLGSSSGIPIWELLTRQEKIGNLTFIFLHLVQLYCKESQIPDCEKVLALYGVSNLLKENDDALDLLDPNHRDSRDALWGAAMNGAFQLPPGAAGKEAPQVYGGQAQTEFEADLNTIADLETANSFSNYDEEVEFGERHPYAVSVPPPPNFRGGFSPNRNLRLQEQQDNKRNAKHQKAQKNYIPSVSQATQKNASHRNQQNERFFAQFDPQSHFQTQPTTPPKRNQNSPIISIAPYDHTPLPYSYYQGTKQPHSYSTLPRGNAPGSVYIIPSDKSREPVLLRILKK